MTGGRLAVTCAFVSIELRARAGWWEPDTRSVSCDARRASKSSASRSSRLRLSLSSWRVFAMEPGGAVSHPPPSSRASRRRRVRAERGEGRRRLASLSAGRGAAGGAEEPANVRVLVQSEQPVVVRVRPARRRRRPRHGLLGRRRARSPLLRGRRGHLLREEPHRGRFRGTVHVVVVVVVGGGGWYSPSFATVAAFSLARDARSRAASADDEPGLAAPAPGLAS